jgi:hypothetical protein
MIKRVVYGNEELAIIMTADFHQEGIIFLTPNEYSQQLGYMNRPAGYSIQPHIHKHIPRAVVYTQEVLFIKSGLIRADFYSNEEVFVESVILGTGDIVLLSSGGHGFEMLEKSEIIEVKQGPYTETNDKVRFTPSAPNIS